MNGLTYEHNIHVLYVCNCSHHESTEEYSHIWT